MKKVQCENKHYFDADAYAVCPHCGAAPAGSPAPAPKAEESKSKSGPKFKMPFFGGHKKPEEPQVPVFATPPVTPQSNIPHTDGGMGQGPVQPYGQTPAAPPPPQAPQYVQDSHTVSIHKANEGAVPPPPAQPDPAAYQPTRGIFNRTPAAPPPAQPVQPVQPATGYQMPPQEQLDPAAYQPTHGIFNHTPDTLQPVPPVTPAEPAEGSYTQVNKTIGIFHGGKGQSDPVAGWLVCLKGANVGASYELFAKKNTIGRLMSNDIVLENEPRVSRDSHAIINFDYKKSDFYLLPSNGDSPYINDEIVLSATKLTRFDKIEIGGCLLLFVPLCGSEFSWDDYIDSEE